MMFDGAKIQINIDAPKNAASNLDLLGNNPYFCIRFLNRQYDFESLRKTAICFVVLKNICKFASD